MVRMCAEVPLSNQYKGIFIGKSHTISVNNEVENYFNLVWEGRMFETILYT